ncbi:hypothetical protein H6F89_03635 [Cyanobacteria bacterium FACHB-63]|nr:hypothetical protein [Cyanobacteria bacterium FACHB-63]
MRNLMGLINQKLSLVGVTGICACAIAVASQAPASAQAAYGSYVGIGPGIGLTSGDDGGSRVSAVVAGRYKFLRSPISLRAQAFIGNGVAIVPTISYDYALNWQTDVYIGAGASIPLGGDTAVGNRTSFAIQPGIDYALPNSNLVVFGNAVIAFDGYRGGGAAATLQGGVGLRF